MDLYDILGVKRGAPLGEIKRAYRRLARRYHPDVNPGDRAAEVRFRQITLAYETLSDPERRHQYDETGVVSASAEVSTFLFEGFDFSVEAVLGDRASTFGDLFADVLRGDARVSPRPGRGADLHTGITLSFEDAMRGTTRPVVVTRQETCRSCGGSGLVHAPETPCLRCGGAGTIRSARGHMVFSRTCSSCGGLGRQVTSLCRTCGGEGFEVRAEAVSVTVPAGVADQARVRVAGKGNVGRHGGPVGDLYVGVHVLPHPLFRRKGDDLHLQVPIAIHEAGLGARIEVPTIDGPATLRLPPGTQSGRQFRLRGRGAPSPGSDRRGDLVVEVRLVLPGVLDERSRALLREFGQIHGEDVRREMLMPSHEPSGGEPVGS
jgi:molecular chaperone DnaJ